MLLGFPVPLVTKLHMHWQQKIFLSIIFASGGLYVARLCITSFTITLSALADEIPEFSVTLVTIIRSAYLIKGYQSGNIFTTDYTQIFIWTNVEANVSIICGQYETLLYEHPRKTSAALKSQHISISIRQCYAVSIKVTSCQSVLGQDSVCAFAV